MFWRAFATLEKRGHSAWINRCRQTGFFKRERKTDGNVFFAAAAFAGLCFSGGSAHDRTHRPGNGCTNHGPANSAFGLCHRQIVWRVRFVTGDFIKAVDHARAFITTAVSNAKQPVWFVNRHKERVTIIDGIGLFERLPTLFQCSPVVRKGRCRLLCGSEAQF